MIKLHSIELKDFLSHSSTFLKIDSQKQSRLLIEGVSGSGKSSIIEAIIWAIYGKGRVENRSLIMAGAKKATVTIELLGSDGLLYRVIRSIKEDGKQTLEAEVMNEDGSYAPLPVSGLKGTQEWLESFIGASYQLFINSVAYPQENSETFVKQTAAKRKDLLLEIIKVADFDAYYERAKAQSQLATEAVTRTRDLIKSLDLNISIESTKELQEKLLKANKTKEEDEQKIVAADVMLAERRELLQHFAVKKSAIEQLRRDLSASEMSTAAIETHVAKITDELSSMGSLLKPASSLSEVTEARAAAAKMLQDLTIKAQERRSREREVEVFLLSKPRERPLEEEIAKLNAELITALKNAAPSLCSLGDDCPNHQSTVKMRTAYIEERIVDKQRDLKEQVEALEKFANDYRLKLEAMPPEIDMIVFGQLNKQLNDYDAELQKHFAYNKTAEMFESRNRELVEKKALIESSKTKQAEERLKLAELETTYPNQIVLETEAAINNLSTDLNILRSHVLTMTIEATRIEERINLVKKTEEQLAEVKQTLPPLERKEKALMLAKDAFGSKGIRAIAVEALIPRLEKGINDVLSQLSDFSVSLETQKASADGENTIEGLYINIVDPQGNNMDFNSYSGGERLKVIVAISEALAGLQKVSFRLIDELFMGLDEESTSSFAAILEKLQAKFEQVLIISHLSLIKDLFNERMLVTKIDGISRVNS